MKNTNKPKYSNNQQKNQNKKIQNQKNQSQKRDNIDNEANVFDLIDFSTKRLYVDVLYNNIKKFNLYTIKQESIEKLCNYLKITNLKEQSNILGTILCITKMYHLNQKINENNIIDNDIKLLFTKTLTLMKKLKITDEKDNLNIISNDAKKNLLFKRHLALLLTYINFRISVKRNREDMRLLIIIYFSIADLSLNMNFNRNQKIKNHTNQNQNQNQNKTNKTYSKISPIYKNDFIKVWKELNRLI